MLLPLIDNYIATPEISRWCRWIEFVLSFLSKKNRGLNLKVSNWKEEIFHQITNWNSRFSAITKFFVDMKLVVKSWHKSRHDLYQLTFLSRIIIFVKKKKEKKMTSTMESNEMERLLRSLARVQEQPRPQTEKESPKKNLCSSLGYFGART